MMEKAPITKHHIYIEYGSKRLDLLTLICQMTIVTKDGEQVKLKPNKAQLKLYEAVAERWEKKLPIRFIILKARQMGFSTFIEAMITGLTFTQPNKSGAIVADCTENATSLFNMTKKYVDCYYKDYPTFFPQMDSNNAKLLSSGAIGSSIRILACGDNTGRSKALQYLHLSEYAFWQKPEETMTALMQTVSLKNMRSMVFIESTANGFNDFKERWDKAEEDKNSPNVGKFIPIFFAWYENDDYSFPYDGHKLSEKENELMIKYNLTLDQIQWWSMKLAESKGNLQQMNQEYPNCPADAFISTGNPVFDTSKLSKRKTELTNRKGDFIRTGEFTYDLEFSRDGSEIAVTNIEWKESPYGNIKIYGDSFRGFPYVLGGDPAEGGADSYVGQVINNVTGEQVATYRVQGIDPDKYAYQLYCLGKYYNEALIGTEVNRASQVMKILQKCGYYNLYRQEVVGNVTNGITNVLGVRTTIKNRDDMIDAFVQRFRDEPKVINDYTTLCEMESFVEIQSDNGATWKRQAIGGKHDDTVMAMAITYYISTQQTNEVDSSEKSNVSTWVDSVLSNLQTKGGSLW